VKQNPSIKSLNWENAGRRFFQQVFRTMQHPSSGWIDPGLQIGLQLGIRL